MFGQHAPPEQREAQIGAHALGAGDPVIARGPPVHRFMPLVYDDGNGVFVIRINGFPPDGIML